MFALQPHFTYLFCIAYALVSIELEFVLCARAALCDLWYAVFSERKYHLKSASQAGGSGQNFILSPVLQIFHVEDFAASCGFALYGKVAWFVTGISPGLVIMSADVLDG
jgi:hypothetical protein